MKKKLFELFDVINSQISFVPHKVANVPREVLPYMGYIGMCRCEGYGF